MGRCGGQFWLCATRGERSGCGSPGPAGRAGRGGSGGFWVCLCTRTLVLAGGRDRLPAVLLLVLRNVFCHTLSKCSGSLCHSEGWFGR